MTNTIAPSPSTRIPTLVAAAIWYLSTYPPACGGTFKNANLHHAEVISVSAAEPFARKGPCSS